MADDPTLTDAEREALRDELAGAVVPTEQQARAVLWFLDGWLSTEDGPGAEWAREYLGEHAAEIAASMVEQGSAQPDGLAERVRALAEEWQGVASRAVRNIEGTPGALIYCLLREAAEDLFALLGDAGEREGRR